MAIINFILCLAALTAAVFSVSSEKPVVLIIVSYVCYALSPLTDFIDIIARAKKGDSPGIVDIYPTFLVCYIILLAAITVIIVVGIAIRQKKMKKRTLLPAIILFILPVRVYADSSWYWISETRPFYVLPWVALCTILIEWLMIWKLPKIDGGLKVLGVVTIANLASFLLPYLLVWLDLSWYGSFQDILNSGPHYIVGAFFLVLTCAVEIPLVNMFLRKKAKDTKLLVRIIVLANIITTIGVAIAEHVITKGAWA